MIGSTIGHYRIESKLGEGGMGVVYRATDTKLDRLVALKFLPDHVSVGTAELERFVQEAKAAAGLNHPNICTIYGIEESDSKHFIAMEFVDGQTLQEKKSSLSMKQALDAGIQIAEGLAAAHEKGIVHRDIKPENIMFRKDGRVQIMDFGLAKLRGASRLTKEGSTVGTAGYMSPEQVQGQETDHRSDIFSLGVLLYEMLTGQPPFKGMHETAIAYEVVNVDSPPMSSIRPDIRQELDAIVLECLEKDPAERTQAASQVAVDLKRFKRDSSRVRVSRVGSAHAPASDSGRVPSSPATAKVFRLLPWTISAAATVVALVLALLTRGADDDGAGSEHVNILAVNVPSQIIRRSDVPCIALSPDGRTVVFTLSDGGVSQLFLRRLDDFEIRPLKGTVNGSAPFFSPDGAWIGFVADGKLKKIPVAGGAVETISNTSGFRGASWGPDDRIYYTPDFASPLVSVSSSGGEILPFSTLDTTRGERTHRWPQVLPGGDWVLYTVGDQRSPNSYEDASLVMQSVKDGRRIPLTVRGEVARYIEAGFLVVGRSGSLFAAPFSPGDGTVKGAMKAFVNGVSGDPGSGVLNFAMSGEGDLLYLPGSQIRDLELVRVRLDGTVVPLPIPAQEYHAPRISPDGEKVAVTIGSPSSENDIWVYDLRKETFSRLTFTKSAAVPIWSKDGKYIFYTTTTADGLILKVRSDGSSQSDTVVVTPGPSYAVSLSPDGSLLITCSVSGENTMISNLVRGTRPEPLMLSEQYAYGGTISPDGRYIFYGSTETGSLEIFVRSFPDLKGKWQVSVGGGISPAWSSGGNEIFYISTVGRLMVVRFKTSPVFSPDSPKELFDVSQMNNPNNPITNFDVAPDGKGFVMIRNTAGPTRTTSFNFVRNWVRLLEKELE